MLKNISMTIDIMTLDEAREAYQEYIKIVNELRANKEIFEKDIHNYDLMISGTKYPEPKYVEIIGEEKFKRLSQSWMNLMDLANLDESYQDQKIDVHQILSGREK